MPKELKNITENIMGQINQGKLKMRPKLYFIIGSLMTFIGLISTMIVSTFLVGLVSFSLRSHGPMGQYRFDQMMANFPWLTLILAIFGLVLGIWLIRQYDFSYKIKPWLLIIIFILTIIISGFVIDIIGLNNNLSKQGPMRGMMKKYNQMDSARFDISVRS
jgi:magnesium-transporting ATPase (P-type)